MSAAISLNNVRLRRGSFELAIDSLELPAGAIVGLVGNNGSGKSTLIDTIAGFLAPDRGQTSVLGLDPLRQAVEVRKQVGWMCDDMAILPVTLGKHLDLLAPFYPSWDRALVDRLLERFGLDPAKRLPKLSKGEATRARLVMTFAFRPRVLLLDEPTTGLDVPSRRKLIGELMDIVREPERTVVISSHQLDDVERISDRIVLLENGRIRGDGTPSEVIATWGTLEERMAAEAS
jgi:ABC-2 type transport system ATP-binding protein